MIYCESTAYTFLKLFKNKGKKKKIIIKPIKETIVLVLLGIRILFIIKLLIIYFAIKF